MMWMFLLGGFCRKLGLNLNFVFHAKLARERGERWTMSGLGKRDRRQP